MTQPEARMLDAIAPLRDFVVAMTALVDTTQEEARLLAESRVLLARLIVRDDWLPDAFSAGRSDRYAQYLLHCDPQERFSVASFVWGPGQATPVHNHTVWGLVGILRGAERCEEFEIRSGQPVATGGQHLMQRGDIDAVSPALGDWHRVSHAAGQAQTISIHVYGANIGAVLRRRLDPAGQTMAFVSGYDSTLLPNLWDRSAALRAAC